MDKSSNNTPTDRYGHMEPDTKPLWHLSIVASSLVMLNKSTEDTLYNMAQVANITQLVGNPLRFHSSVTVTKCMLLSRYSESHSVNTTHAAWFD